jgi:hypothetical protein
MGSTMEEEWMAAEVRARRALTLDESVPATEGIHD